MKKPIVAFFAALIAISASGFAVSAAQTDSGMNVAEATMAPRVHQHMSGAGSLQVERGLSPDTLRLLEGRGHDISSGQTIGSTQMLLVVPGRVEGAADPRRPGAAAIAQ